MNAITAPTHITSLATSGILIHIEVKAWTATKQDKEITDEVTVAKSADPTAGKFLKNLMANVDEHKALIRNRADWYNWITAWTYPWAGAWRYLPNARIPEFMAKYKERYALTQNVWHSFRAMYPTAMSNAAFTLGDTFKATDYPSVDEVMAKCSVTLHTAEVPTGDFRNAISQELADDLHNHYSQQAERLKTEIVQQQRDQFRQVMEAIAKGCDIKTVTDDEGNMKVRRGKLFEGTLEKALEYCDTFRTFNLDADPALEQARQTLEDTLRGVSIDKLRDSDGMRAMVKDSVNDILAKFGGASI